MSPKSKHLLTLALLSLFLLTTFTPKIGASNEDTATSAITLAEKTITSAYETILETERVKANVSGLLDQLNNASKYLAEARMLRYLEDFDGAVNFANTARTQAEYVRVSAEELKIKAYESWIGGLLIRIIGSIVGIVAVVFGTFIAWRVFKKRYFRVVIRDEEEATVIET